MGRDWSTGATSFVIFVNFCSTTYYFLKCPQKISPQLQLLKQVKFDLFWKVLPSLFCALVHCVVLALTLCYSVWAWSYSAEKILATEVGFSAIFVEWMRASPWPAAHNRSTSD